jgi:hypothetical protein
MANVQRRALAFTLICSELRYVRSLSTPSIKWPLKLVLSYEDQVRLEKSVVKKGEYTSFEMLSEVRKLEIFEAASRCGGPETYEYHVAQARSLRNQM